MYALIQIQHHLPVLFEPERFQSQFSPQEEWTQLETIECQLNDLELQMFLQLTHH